MGTLGARRYQEKLRETERPPRRWTGLILGCLGIVIAPALLLFSGILTPSRAPEMANENRAITSLRVLNIAAQAYAATYGNGFPESLSQLGPPAGQAQLDSNASGFVASEYASGKAFGFRFSYLVTGRDPYGHPNAYKITADPLPSGPPRLPHFLTD